MVPSQQENSFRLKLKFWGVRGSIPTPVQENMGYGGNTTALEIRLGGGDILLIDGGTGIRDLGRALDAEFAERKIEADLFLTHFHWDHIQGLPFFTPLYKTSNEVTFHSAHPTARVRDVLEGQMSHPYFPVPFGLLAAARELVQLEMRPSRRRGYCITPFPLNHPQGATGYRVEADGAVIVHASDLEHGDPKHDRILLEHAEGADILVYDSQFTPEEYEARRGWGHSTWLEATRVARQARVGQLVLFHHDPAHHDARMDEILASARAEFENTVAARESATLTI